MKGTTNSQRGIGGNDSEKAVISLKTNQASHADLIGVKFKVVINGVTTEYIWEGNSITLDVPAFTTYTIEYNEVQGYSSPNTFTAIAVPGNDRFVTGMYRTELLTINVSADEGVVSGYKVQIIRQVPTGYTELKYIQSDGTQYIDTGVYGRSGVSSKMDIKIDALPLEATIVGAQSGGRHAYLAHYYYSWCCGIGSYSQTGITPVIGTRYTLDTVLAGSQSSMTVNGTTTSLDFGSADVNLGVTMYVCACNKGGIASYFSKVKIYSLKIYEDSILVRDYIPVKNSSGIAGLYDRVEDKFHPSETDSNFFAGPVVGEWIEESEVLHTQTSISGTYKIPYGTRYMVKATPLSGFYTPKGYVFSNSQNAREVNVIYHKAAPGVFIQGVSGRLYTKEEWSFQEDSNGVAVVTENCRFVMAKEDVKENVSWGAAYLGILGLIGMEREQAMNDYDGPGNTAKIIEAIGNTNDGYRDGTAAGDAAEYVFPNGQFGYLGSAGEWIAVYNNLEAVNEILVLLGNSLGAAKWTSTAAYQDPNYAWSFNQSEGLRYYDRYNTIVSVRAFLAL